MKYFTVLNKAFILFVAAFFAARVASAQESKNDKKQDKIAKIESLVQSKNFVFVAQSAFPTSGRNINLTSTYDVRLSADTVVSDLPYLGRAYVAPMDPTEGGIHFTSTKFSYDVKERKKGGWDITIMPNDTRDVRQMYLTVSQDGYATLQVCSENRQNISFSGYITSGNKSR